MRQIPIDQLGSLKTGEQTVEIRFTNSEGQTEAWIVNAKMGVMPVINPLRDKVRLAYIDNGTDSRISRQRETIDRLLSHVHAHCPAYGVKVAEGEPPVLGNCGFVWEGDLDALVPPETETGHVQAENLQSDTHHGR